MSRYMVSNRISKFEIFFRLLQEPINQTMYEKWLNYESILYAGLTINCIYALIGCKVFSLDDYAISIMHNGRERIKVIKKKRRRQPTCQITVSW